MFKKELKKPNKKNSKRPIEELDEESEYSDMESDTLQIDETTEIVDDFIPPKKNKNHVKKFKIIDEGVYKVVKWPLFMINGEEIYVQCAHKKKMKKYGSVYKCAEDGSNMCGFQMMVSTFKALVDNNVIKLDESGKTLKNYHMLWCDSCNNMNMFMNTSKPEWSTYMIPYFKCLVGCEKCHAVSALEYPEMEDSYHFGSKKKTIKDKKITNKADSSSSKKFIPNFDTDE